MLHWDGKTTNCQYPPYIPPPSFTHLPAPSLPEFLCILWVDKLFVIDSWAEHEETKQKEDKKETESGTVLAPVDNRTKLKDVEQSKVLPVCDKNSTVNGHDSDSSDSSDHTDNINSADNVNQSNCNNHTHDSMFEKTEYHNTQNKLEERHTISTVQTVQIPGGSEVRTVQTVELRKITTNGTADQHQPTNLQNRNHEE